MVNVQGKAALAADEEKKLWGILSQFTAEEIAFIIHYYDELGFLIMNDSVELERIIDNEQMLQGSTLGQFSDMLEIIYKAGTGGKRKNNAEKIAQRLKKSQANFISDEDFFILTKAIYVGHPIILMYLSHVIIDSEVNK